MASDTAIVLHGVEPVALCEFGWDAMLAVELILCRDVKHRVPVNCRVVLCGSCLIRRHRRRQVQLFSRFARNLGRSEEHTSELQSRLHLVCRLLLEKTNKQ